MRFGRRMLQWSMVAVALATLSTSQPAFGDKVAGRWKRTLNPGSGNAWVFKKELRRTELVFRVSTRVTKDDDVGHDVNFLCEVERQNANGEWESVTTNLGAAMVGYSHTNHCLADVPRDKGNYRLHLLNHPRLSVTADFTVELRQSDGD